MSLVPRGRYGIPRYGEVNPGAFAVILFPFLFAIMFGDVGHGALMVLLALGFIANEEKLLKTKLDDIVGMAFGGRYAPLLLHTPWPRGMPSSSMARGHVACPPHPTALGACHAAGTSSF